MSLFVCLFFLLFYTSWSTLLITFTQIVHCQPVELRYLYKCTICGRDIILAFLVKPIEVFHIIFLKVCHYKYCEMFNSFMANLLFLCLFWNTTCLIYFERLYIQTSGVTVLHLYFVTNLVLMWVTPASWPTVDVLLGQLILCRRMECHRLPRDATELPQPATLIPMIRREQLYSLVRSWYKNVVLDNFQACSAQPAFTLQFFTVIFLLF